MSANTFRSTLLQTHSIARAFWLLYYIAIRKNTQMFWCSSLKFIVFYANAVFTNTEKWLFKWKLMMLCFFFSPNHFTLCKWSKSDSKVRASDDNESITLSILFSIWKLSMNLFRTVCPFDVNNITLFHKFMDKWEYINLSLWMNVNTHVFVLVRTFFS